MCIQHLMSARENHSHPGWSTPFVPISWSERKPGIHCAVPVSTFHGRTNRLQALSNRRVSATTIQAHFKERLEKSVNASLSDIDELTGIQLGLICGEEVTHPLLLYVEGKIPSFLAKGTYYQSGPGLFKVTHKDGKEFTAEHWFDGLGMLHAFSFDAEKGTVHYRSKMTSESVKRTIEGVAGDDYSTIHVFKRWESDSFVGRMKRLLSPLSADPVTGKQPYNVSVTLQELPTKGFLNASTDANVLHRLDGESLETVEEYDFSHFNSRLVDMATSSHGMLDSRTGEYFNYVFSYFLGKAIYKVFRICPDGTSEVMTTFADYPYYLHSFSLTDNFVIMILWPAEVKTLKLLRTKSLSHAMQMRADTPTKFVVISRKLNKVVCTYEHAAFFCLHTVNAFERGDELVVDLIRYKDVQVIPDLRIENLWRGGKVEKGRLTRFTLPNLSAAVASGAGTAHAATSHDLAGSMAFEFGTVSQKARQRSQRFVFGLSGEIDSQLYDRVVKVDLTTGRLRQWGIAGMVAGEPLFVARPGAAREDDGVLLVGVLDSQRHRTSLVVLNARDMRPVATAHLPAPVPLAFHGRFCPRADGAGGRLAVRDGGGDSEGRARVPPRLVKLDLMLRRLTAMARDRLDAQRVS